MRVKYDVAHAEAQGLAYEPGLARLRELLYYHEKVTPDLENLLPTFLVWFYDIGLLLILLLLFLLLLRCLIRRSDGDKVNLELVFQYICRVKIMVIGQSGRL